MKNYITRTCTECEGEGSIEIGPDCLMPASMCCGGCYKTVQCDECNGTGSITEEADEDEY